MKKKVIIGCSCILVLVLAIVLIFVFTNKKKKPVVDIVPTPTVSIGNDKEIKPTDKTKPTPTDKVYDITPVVTKKPNNPEVTKVPEITVEPTVTIILTPVPTVEVTLSPSEIPTPTPDYRVLSTPTPTPTISPKQNPLVGVVTPTPIIVVEEGSKIENITTYSLRYNKSVSFGLETCKTLDANENEYSEVIYCTIRSYFDYKNDDMRYWLKCEKDYADFIDIGVCYNYMLGNMFLVNNYASITFTVPETGYEYTISCEYTVDDTYAYWDIVVKPKSEGAKLSNFGVCVFNSQSGSPIDFEYNVMYNYHIHVNGNNKSFQTFKPDSIN